MVGLSNEIKLLLLIGPAVGMLMLITIIKCKKCLLMLMLAINCYWFKMLDQNASFCTD
jgi:hypothetical protein